MGTLSMSRDTEDTGRIQEVVDVRLIIWPRGAHSGQTPGTDQADLSRDSALHFGDGVPHVRSRLRSVPPPRGGQPGSLWLCRSQSFLRRVAEEWENAVHLRPACP